MGMDADSADTVAPSREVEKIAYRIWTALPLLIALICSFVSGLAAAQTDVQTVVGRCSNRSHVAEGPIGDDLTKRQSRFFCDIAVIAFFDQTNTHVMIQFSQKESHHGAILGFAGDVARDGKMMTVTKVYLTAGQATEVSDGNCKFFFSGRHMSGIFCGAKIDEGDRRTVVIVAFDAASGQ